MAAQSGTPSLLSAPQTPIKGGGLVAMSLGGAPSQSPLSITSSEPPQMSSSSMVTHVCGASRRSISTLTFMCAKCLLERPLHMQVNKGSQRW